MGQHRKNKILIIIDDNQDIHNDIKKILTPPASTSELDSLVQSISGCSEPERFSLDMQIDSALQEDDGISMVRQAKLDGNPYALAFVEIRIPPGLDGAQTIKQLQLADDRLQVIIITAYSDYSWDDIQTETTGRDNLLILKKPFEAIEIRQLTSTLLEKWHLSQEREDTIKKLKQERDNFADLLTAMEDGVYIVNQQHDIQFVNHALEKVFGSWHGRKCYKVFHDRQEKCPWCKNKEVFSGKTVHWEHYMEKTGRTYDLVDTPMVGQDGSLLKLEIVRDVTELKKQEKQQLKIGKQKEEIKKIESLKTMAGAIAHRFNNAMTVVLGNLELLEMTIAPDSPDKKNVSDALKVAKEASMVGSQMLTYVSPQPLRLTPVNLVSLTGDCAVELKSRFLSSISLNFITPLEPLYCSMDSPQIKEVINSVITNAIESLQDATGTVEITFGTKKYETDSISIAFQNDNLKEDELYSFCQIRDTGNGIDIEDLPRIFEPFFTTKFVGRGLGLALTVGIMRAHHGALTVESVLDQGTTVRILLPAITG